MRLWEKVYVSENLPILLGLRFLINDKIKTVNRVNSTWPAQHSEVTMHKKHTCVIGPTRFSCMKMKANESRIKIWTIYYDLLWP